MLKSILVLIILSLFLGTAAWLFFVWAVKKGAFDDVERAKYRMLEDDDAEIVKQPESKTMPEGENIEEKNKSKASPAR
ncbi:MAG: hypothetical protein AMJ60_04995 [Desulfobacterales bacterium SG8_35]|nr:MAG: hypothetical protein AMJ60_04995 [Desulfobacterales bacterium SG8_35]